MRGSAATLSAHRSVRDGGSYLILALGAAIFVVHALAPAPLPIHLRMLAALPGAVACFLWWRYFVGKDFERLPFLEYAVTQVYLYWGLAAVTTSAGDLAGASPRGWAGAVVATGVVTAGFVAVHPAGKALGACAARSIERWLPPTAPRMPPVVVLAWLAFSAAVHADVLAGVFPSSVYYLTQTVGDYSPLLAAIAWRDLRGGGRSAWLVVCTVTLSLAGLLTGMMEAAIQPVLLATTLYVVLQRRIPWRFLAAGVLIVVVLNPAKRAYRDAAWEDTQSRQEHAAKDVGVAARRWWKALQTTWASDQSDGATNTAGLASRLNELSINAVVVDRTAVALPFDRGQAWGYLPVSFVPRFLYPGKPNFTSVYNDRFSVTFGFQTLEETETSTGAFPLVSDGYWNWGWPGVVFATLVSGGLVGVFAGLFRARSWASTALAASTFAQLHANNAMALQVIGVAQHVAGLSILLWATWALSAAVDAARRSGRPEAGTVSA